MLLISRDGGQAIVDERFKDREARLDGGRERILLRDRVNGFQAVAGNAGDGRVARIDVALLEQFLSDAGGYAAGRFGENSFGFGEQLNAFNDFRIGNVFRPAAAFANRARGVITVRRISDGERARNRCGFLRLELFELAFDGV